MIYYNPITLPLVMLGIALLFGAGQMNEQYQLVHQEELLRQRWEREHPGETFGYEPSWEEIGLRGPLGINPGLIRLTVEDL